MEAFGYQVPTWMVVVAAIVVGYVIWTSMPASPEYRYSGFQTTPSGPVEIGELNTGLSSIEGHIYVFKPDNTKTCYIVSVEDEGTGISCLYDPEDYPR